MERISHLIEKIRTTYYQNREKTLIDLDLLLDYTRVMYADLLEWRADLESGTAARQSAPGAPAATAGPRPAETPGMPGRRPESEAGHPSGPAATMAGSTTGSTETHAPAAGTIAGSAEQEPARPGEGSQAGGARPGESGAPRKAGAETKGETNTTTETVTGAASETEAESEIGAETETGAESAIGAETETGAESEMGVKPKMGGETDTGAATAGMSESGTVAESAASIESAPAAGTGPGAPAGPGQKDPDPNPVPAGSKAPAQRGSSVEHHHNMENEDEDEPNKTVERIKNDSSAISFEPPPTSREHKEDSPQPKPEPALENIPASGGASSIPENSDETKGKHDSMTTAGSTLTDPATHRMEGMPASGPQTPGGRTQEFFPDFKKIFEKANTSKPEARSDIRKLIGINDKYLFLNELFNNHKTEYEETLDHLNGMDSAVDARQFLEKEIAPKYKWRAEDATVESFYWLVERHLKR